MLFESIMQFNTDGSTWDCGSDAYGASGAFDLGATIPTLQNTDEVMWWIQVTALPTSDNASYQFILRCSATTDGTDLNGTVVNVLTTPAWVGSGSFLQRTSQEGGFFSVFVPQICNLRYWEMYVEYTANGGAGDLYIQAGLALKSAIIHRVRNLSQLSGIVCC